MASAPTLSVMRRTITSVVVVALLLVGGVQVFKKLAGMRKESEKRAGSRLPELVRTATAAREDYREQLTAYGRARALRRTVRSAEVGGRVRCDR